ncbi:MAG TPA: IS630 transposase-related protein [Gemmatimonadales bacterium]|nr:IS630 transposase-related protein [Gemmatimonadales bacterium]
MARALSIDLRQRVVDAVTQGMSRRRAAARFGVSVASAIRWAAQQNTTGTVAPKKQGGDRRSDRIENEADFISGEVEKTPDITLGELQAKLKEERGQRFGIATIGRFFERRRITRKKRRHRRPSTSAPT